MVLAVDQILGSYETTMQASLKVLSWGLCTQHIRQGGSLKLQSSLQQESSDSMLAGLLC